MVLYTVLTHDEIFPSEMEMNQLVVYNGRQCYVKKHQEDSYELVQLLSTDPNDFLRDDFRPGTIIKYH